MADVYEYIGRSIRKSNEVDADIGKISDELILPGGFNEIIYVHVNGLKQTKQNIDFDNSFILSSPRGGVLGTNPLGLTYSPELYSVYNGEDTYYETLDANTFIDTGSSTATITLSDKIELGSGEEYITNKVFFSKEDNCEAAKFLISTGSYNLDDATIEFRNDEGNSWQIYDSDSEEFLYFNDPGKELQLKITSTGSDNYMVVDAAEVLFKIQYLRAYDTYIFEESGESLLFNDASNTTGVVIDTDPLNPLITFNVSAGQYQSEAIPLRNIYSTVELSIGSIVGTADYYISNDSKASWTPITEGVPLALTFNTTDTAYVRFIRNDASNVVIYRDEVGDNTQYSLTFTK